MNSLLVYLTQVNSGMQRNLEELPIEMVEESAKRVVRDIADFSSVMHSHFLSKSFNGKEAHAIVETLMSIVDSQLTFCEWLSKDSIYSEEDAEERSKEETATEKDSGEKEGTPKEETVSGREWKKTENPGDLKGKLDALLDRAQEQKKDGTYIVNPTPYSWYTEVREP